MIIGMVLLAAATVSACTNDDAYLRWNAKEAKSIASAHRKKGRIGKGFDFRITGTDRSYNYKLRATWLTPDVIRATARLRQLSMGLSNDETCQLAAEAEAVADTVFLIEIDPREGSGVIPREWTAMLSPRSVSGQSPRRVTGVSNPGLRKVPALSGAHKRDYAYDVFWIVFPLRLPDGHPLFTPEDSEAELTVRIYNKVEQVHWPIPDSVRDKPDADKRE